MRYSDVRFSGRWNRARLLVDDERRSGLPRRFGEHGHDILRIVFGDRLVERDADAGGVVAEVDAPRFRQPAHDGSVGALDPQRVEILAIGLREAERADGAIDGDGGRVDPRRNRAQALGAVVDRIHRRDVGQKRLRRADVGRRLLAADVLFARLQRHAIRLLAARVDRESDDAAWRLPHVGLARGEERRVRTAAAERHAEALRVADDGIGADLARRRDQREREKIGGDGDERARGVRALDRRTKIGHRAALVRILQQDAERLRNRLLRHAREIDDFDLDVERLGAAAQHVERLRIAPFRDEEHALAGADLLRLQPMEHRHRFARRRAFVEERRRRDVHAGQVANDRLEVEQRLEAALRDLRLIRRVRRVPAGVLEDVAQDHARRHAVVVAHADVRTGDGVARGDAAQTAQVGVLGFAFRQVERRLAANGRRNGLIDQHVERWHADRVEHRGAVGVVRADVS